MTPKDLTPRATLVGLKAYAEEHEGGLNLKDNTNLWGTNPAIEKGLRSLTSGDLWHYPTLTSEPLREALARQFSIPAEGVITGNGSNEIIDMIVRAFLNPGDRLAFHPPTFSMVSVFAGMHGATLAPAPLTDDWGLDVDGLVKANGKVTFVCRPNNPTGNAFPRADVARVIEEAPGVVVVDEAYEEFCGGTFLSDLHRYDNLIVLRTFSKAQGLAGLRVGYAASSPALAAELNKVRAPFRLNVASERVALFALREKEFVEATVRGVHAERPRLQRELQARGFTVYPGDANFLFTKPPVDAKALAGALFERGVSVRDFGGDLAPYLRVSVGPPEVRDRFLAALDGALEALR